MDYRECSHPEPHAEHDWPIDIEQWVVCSGGGR